MLAGENGNCENGYYTPEMPEIKFRVGRGHDSPCSRKTVSILCKIFFHEMVASFHPSRFRRDLPEEGEASAAGRNFSGIYLY